MGLYISNMKYIQRYADTGVMIVHHSGKDQAAGARGHSSLRAATDTEIEITAEKKNRLIKTCKQRDGESDIVIPFRLMVIELGKDEDGDTIDTCHVVLETDSEFESLFLRPEDELTGTKKAAYLTLLQFQKPEFMQWCKDKEETEIRKLIVKHWFLTKNDPEKVLSLNELEKAKAKYKYSTENSNFSGDFDYARGYFDNKKRKLSQWIKEYLVKPSQALSG